MWILTRTTSVTHAQLHSLFHIHSIHLQQQRPMLVIGGWWRRYSTDRIRACFDGQACEPARAWACSRSRGGGIFACLNLLHACRPFVFVAYDVMILKISKSYCSNLWMHHIVSKYPTLMMMMMVMVYFMALQEHMMMMMMIPVGSRRSNRHSCKLLKLIPVLASPSHSYGGTHAAAAGCGDASDVLML